MTFASEKIRAFSVGGRVNLVSSKTRGDTTHHVETSFPKDDAPAVALAVLEAAGIDGKQSSHAHHAARALMDHESVRQLEAEREAEEQRTRDFYRVQGIIIREVDDLHVFRYNAARKFFEES